MNRRHFLKVAGMSAFALSSSLSFTNLAAAASAKYAKSETALTAGRWAMVIDTRAITTKEQVEIIQKACHKAHNVPNMPAPREIKWIWGDSFEHAFPDDLNQFISNEVKERPFLLLCNHCSNPSCVRVCPTGATFKTADGLVAMDYHRCVGCRFCMAACPYGSRSFNFTDGRDTIENIDPTYPARSIGVVEKCTFCTERLEKGLLPACVEASEGAIIFGDLNDPESNVRQALAENFSIRRKPSLGTDPGVYYLV